MQIALSVQTAGPLADSAELDGVVLAVAMRLAHQKFAPPVVLVVWVPRAGELGLWHAEVVAGLLVDFQRNRALRVHALPIVVDAGGAAGSDLLFLRAAGLPEIAAVELVDLLHGLVDLGAQREGREGRDALLGRLVLFCPWSRPARARLGCLALEGRSLLERQGRDEVLARRPVSGGRYPQGRGSHALLLSGASIRHRALLWRKLRHPRRALVRRVARSPSSGMVGARRSGDKIRHRRVPGDRIGRRASQTGFAAVRGFTYIDAKTSRSTRRGQCVLVFGMGTVRRAVNVWRRESGKDPRRLAEDDFAIPIAYLAIEFISRNRRELARLRERSSCWRGGKTGGGRACSRRCRGDRDTGGRLVGRRIANDRSTHAGSGGRVVADRGSSRAGSVVCRSTDRGSSHGRSAGSGSAFAGSMIGSGIGAWSIGARSIGARSIGARSIGPRSIVVRSIRASMADRGRAGDRSGDDWTGDDGAADDGSSDGALLVLADVEG